MSLVCLELTNNSFLSLQGAAVTPWDPTVHCVIHQQDSANVKKAWLNSGVLNVGQIIMASIVVLGVYHVSVINSIPEVFSVIIMMVFVSACLE